MKLEIIFKDGRKKTFDSVVSFNVTEEQKINEELGKVSLCNSFKGEFFKVTPLEIDRSKFTKSMSDQQQERTRKIIQEAFAEVDKCPEKYSSSFYTLIPEKTWKGSRTVSQLKDYANEVGGEMANWIELALEWAQRISNGTSWEDICNYVDTSKWNRMIVWKNGYARIIGDSRNDPNIYTSSGIHCFDYHSYDKINGTVPLVVIKKQ